MHCYVSFSLTAQLLCLQSMKSPGDLHERLQESEKLMKDMSKTWEQKLEETEQLHKVGDFILRHRISMQMALLVCISQSPVVTIVPRYSCSPCIHNVSVVLLTACILNTPGLLFCGIIIIKLGFLLLNVNLRFLQLGKFFIR